MKRAVALALLLAGAEAAAQVSATLPARPWSRARHVSLPGACAGGLIARPAGGAGVVIGPAPGLAVIGRDGELERAWRWGLHVGEDAWWVGRDVLHAVRGRDLLVAFGVDGTLRGAAPIPDVPLGRVALHGARESVLVFGGASPLVAARFGWDASPIAGEAGGAGWRPASSGPVVDPSGAVWLAAGAGLLRLSRETARVPLLRGIRRLVARDGGGLFAVAEGEVLSLDIRGNLLGRSAIDATVIDVVARGDGGAAALLQASPPRVVVFDGLAVARARFPAAADARGLTASADGSLLVVSRDGTLAAHEADGTPRWRLTLPGPIRPPVVALAPDRFAVATERDEVIALELADPAPPR